MVILFHKLLVRLFQFQSGALFCQDLTLGTLHVAHEQSYDNSGNDQYQRSEKRHVIAEHVQERIRIKLIGISECKFLRILRSEQTDAAVQKS